MILPLTTSTNFGPQRLTTKLNNTSGLLVLSKLLLYRSNKILYSCVPTKSMLRADLPCRDSERISPPNDFDSTSTNVLLDKRLYFIFIEHEIYQTNIILYIIHESQSNLVHGNPTKTLRLRDKHTGLIVAEDDWIRCYRILDIQFVPHRLHRSCGVFIYFFL